MFKARASGSGGKLCQLINRAFDSPHFFEIVVRFSVAEAEIAEMISWLHDDFLCLAENARRLAEKRYGGFVARYSRLIFLTEK
jgi:hypothetical protein